MIDKNIINKELIAWAKPEKYIKPTEKTQKTANDVLKWLMSFKNRIFSINIEAKNNGYIQLKLQFGEKKIEISCLDDLDDQTFMVRYSPNCFYQPYVFELNEKIKTIIVDFFKE